MDPLIRYLDDQMKISEKDSAVLAQSVNGLLNRIAQDQVNVERMRGALDKYHKDYAVMLAAREARQKELDQLAVKEAAVREVAITGLAIDGQVDPNE